MDGWMCQILAQNLYLLYSPTCPKTFPSVQLPPRDTRNQPCTETPYLYLPS